ncbi:MAG: general secretion pathway protein GspK, partial [Verrucomicrobia bacterium]|nr:general secretion pathway protein GspK [Verrucomicrobiota bacterium]
MRTRASILVGLLWALAILSVIVIGVLHTARLDLVVVKNYGDLIQAHYLALAGLEKAKALLYQDAVSRRENHLNHTGDLYDAPLQFRDVPFGRGQFRVFRPAAPATGSGLVYGISDEECRLNVNYASADELGKIYGMTPDLVAAILDWRDPDNEVSPGGAEADYYLGLQPPYLPRNGPLQTVSELLMVRGVTPVLLFGPYAGWNGPPLVARAAGGAPAPADSPYRPGESGWARILTVDSIVENVNAGGEDRVNIQSADENSLSAVRGISRELARAIVAYRAQHRLESLADLLDVTPVQNPGRPGA